MISLSTGVWGSFIAPCSRALGGKSGMTRAAPLVSIIPPAHTSSHVFSLPEGPTALLLPLILLVVWVSHLPPQWRTTSSLYAQEQRCPMKREGGALVRLPTNEPCQRPHGNWLMGVGSYEGF